MIKDLKRLDLFKMKVGDVLDIYYGEYLQASITCTQNCGFKYYIVLGNGIESKIFFEGNSDKDRGECITKLHSYVLFLENEYNHTINDVKAVPKQII